MNEHEPTPGRNMARLMWTVFWILLLGLLTLWFGHQQARLNNPNPEPLAYVSEKFLEVDLLANRRGHYLSGGAINGQPVTFLLDTGATDVVVPADIAQQVGMVPGAAHMAQTANGSIRVFSSTITELQIGPITLRDISASINPNIEGPILLGMSALRHLELRQFNNRLQLRQYL